MESEFRAGSNSPVCVEFWYHMYASLLTSIGDLNVWKVNKNDNSYTLLWTLTSSQSNTWYEGRVSYIEPNYHTIVFEGIFSNKKLRSATIDLANISFYSIYL